METSRPEDSQTLSTLEEIEGRGIKVSEQNNIVMGERYCEYVYCKSGFDTAKSFGGHMNIHRKHRAVCQNQQHN